MLEKLVRYYGRRKIQKQIEFDLYCRHFHWDEPIPLSLQEIWEYACVIEAQYYDLYLAPRS